MIPFHVQILTHFTYHVGYKPIFTSHECHLLIIKGVKNQNTVIMDPNSHFIWWSPRLLSSECRWGDLKGRWRAVVDVGNSCFQACVQIENTLTPPMWLFLQASDWSLCGKRRLVFWLVLLLFSRRAHVCPRNFSLRPNKTGTFCASYSECDLRGLSLG